MRAQMKLATGAALLALVLNGCMAADVLPTSTMAGARYPYDSSTGLVGSSPRGGGGTSGAVSDVQGATTALFQTSLGPVAWKGVQLARLQGTGPSLLWNAPPDRYGQALAIPQDGVGVAVGYGIARYQGGAWNSDVTDLDAVLTPTAASGQRVLLTDVGFAAGDATVGYAVGTRGTVLRYDPAAGRWKAVTGTGLAAENLGSVKVIAANDVWVAGQVLLHFDGAAWTRVTAVPGEISGLAVVAANNVWASTGSGLYQWDGRAWTQPFASTGVTVGAPQIASFDGTIVGLALEPGVPSGAVFTYQDGAWKTETVTVPQDVGLDTVVLASQTLAYAKTYDNSGVYRFDLATKTWSRYAD